MSEADTTLRDPVEINLKTLLQSGAHFGTKKRFWHPKMANFIYGMRDQNYIINLDLTIKYWEIARKAIVDNVSSGGEVLVVCTQEAIKDLVKEEANLGGYHYLNNKWLGGTLTNFDQLQRSLTRLDKLDKLIDAVEVSQTIKLNKKEVLGYKRERDNLLRDLEGLRKMKKLPSLVFVTNPIKTHLAVYECSKLLIPVIGLSDTDMNPKALTYPIPSNDDANSTLVLFVKALTDAVMEGKALRQKTLQDKETASAN